MKRLLLTVFIAGLFSCNDTTENAKHIVGHWKAVEWQVDGKPSESNAAATSFDFAADGKYTYDFSGHKENGLYKIDGNNLYTTPEGQQEMMVQIAKLSGDSLVFNMNRGGRPEMITLLRK